MSRFALGRDRLGDPSLAGQREWLVTNGIGGFAAGTVSGALGRRQHGLLFAALRPPLGRTLLLAKLSERVELDGQWLDLDTNAWHSGALHPTGHLHLESFRLEDSIPAWRWAIGDTRIEKRIWMEHGENTTYVQYRLAAGRGPVTLSLRALANHRDAGGLITHGEWTARIEPATGGLRIEAYDGATPLWLLAPGAQVRAEHAWYRGFSLGLEEERGVLPGEDHLHVGEILVRLAPGEYFTVIASTRRDAGTGEAAPLALASAMSRRRAHDRAVLDAWRRAQPAAAREAPAWIRQLVLAADGFLVERSTPVDPNGRGVSAGYLGTQGGSREFVMALPGLTLATGRPESARAALVMLARHLDRGVLPPGAPDATEIEHAAPDASLWLIQAVRACCEATGEAGLVAELFPVLEDVIEWYTRGTHGGIEVDPEDGLLRVGGTPGPATWMNAWADGHPVTARHGKAVEVNALWFNALTAMAAFAKRLRRSDEAYLARARTVERSFRRFWNPATGGLFDVLDGAMGDDPAFRPNQILAVSLPDSPLTQGQRRAVLETCGRWLVTSHGLRSLGPAHAEYVGAARRDSAHRHQGSAWVWLLAHYVLAHERVHGRRDALAFLDPLEDLAAAGCIGWLPESADGDPPHAPAGGMANAVAVAEVLRAYHALAGDRRRVRRRPRTVLEAAGAAK